MLYRALLFFCLIVFLAGCNGVEPAGPNVYQAPGCPTFTMAEDFVYAGSPDLTIETYCVRNCRPLQGDSRVKSYAKVYVAATAGVDPVEVCVFERDVFKERRVYWAPTDGRDVKYGGKIYREKFGYYTVGSETGLSVFERQVADAGYETTSPGFSLYYVSRNISQRTRLTVIYAYNYEKLPAAIKGDSEKIKVFLREKFAERIANL